MVEQVNYQRLRIHADLTLISELHVGSGKSAEIGERTSDRNGETSTALYDAICLDYQQKPYLPGSTLRGVLRSLALSCIDDSDWVNQLFGQQQSSDNAGCRLRVHDAFIQSMPETKNYSNSRMTESDKHLPSRIAHGIVIDPVRQVVDEHKLFQFEVIPEGTVFSVIVEGDDLDRNTVLLLCQLLKHWQKQRVAMGRNHLKGNGLVECLTTRIEVADQHSINAWLAGEADDFYKEWVVPSEVDSFAPRDQAALSYQFESIGMMLVNDPDIVKKKSDDHTPQQVFAQLENGQAVVPGKAIKGLLRSHARKIMATLLVNQGVSLKEASNVADQALSSVFGSSEEASMLSFTNALSASKSPRVKKQAFIAVDRFTGGVKEGALFHVEGTLNEAFTGDIVFINRTKSGSGKDDVTKNWWKGLLSYVVRDMMEGDGYLGWGKSRGYGRFKLSQFTINGKTIQRWEEVTTLAPEAELKHWLAAFQHFIEQQVEANIKGRKMS